jgi:hypothetical protein
MAAKGVVKPLYRAMPVDRELARRTSRIVHTLGERDAVRRLGVGKPTLEAVVGYGALLPSTIDRIRESVERVEGELAVAAGVAS